LHSVRRQYSRQFRAIQRRSSKARIDQRLGEFIKTPAVTRELVR
jgi:hypothetical protein